ncbi:MAG: hypothetical protein HY680_02410 [Chloroflexi bacterium]|nr:hypothetical protein [Chloroflexota bacterium]
MSDDKLKQAIRALFRPRQPKGNGATARGETEAGLDLSPRTGFDVVLDQRLKALEEQAAELKGRVNGLMAAVAAAVVVQVVLSLFR